MQIFRTVEPRLKKLAVQFKVVAVMGPHGSGKTTLVQTLFPEYRFVSLRDPKVRQEAAENPRGFLAIDGPGLILDEAHLVPELFCYMRGIVDNSQRRGQFILTMPVDFIRYSKIKESLACRIAL